MKVEQTFSLGSKPRFRSSSDPAAKLLLEYLTDPKRDSNFHREQVVKYLDSCQKRTSQPESAIEWFGLLVQRRADVDKAEISDIV